MKNKILILLLILAGSSCTSYHTYEAVFSPSNSQLQNYQQIIIKNSKPGDQLNDLMENSLKAKLTAITPGNINPSKKIQQISNEIKFFNYHPKIKNISPNKIAYLKFKIDRKIILQRQQNTQQVPLTKCNYLKKYNPCYTQNYATIKNGHQNLEVIISGKIHLLKNDGSEIIPATSFHKIFSEKNRIIKSPLNLTFKACNAIAYEFAQQITPYRKMIKTQFLNGDSESIAMIQNRAYNMAINHLNKIITADGANPKAGDLYHMGIAFEALNEIPAAYDYYYKAEQIMPNNQVIKTAINRLKKIIPQN